MKKFAIVMLAVAMSGLLVAAAQKPANVSGEWTLTVTTPRGDCAQRDAYFNGLEA